jgi:hypothetical protein
MSELPHDPNSLSDELDRVLPPGQHGQSAASNDPLVQAAARLSAAPRPALSPEALARIHTTMQAAQSTPPSPSRSLTRRFLHQSAPARLAIAAVLLFVFVSGAIFAAKIGIQVLQPATATETLLPPSATPFPPTATRLPPSPTMTLVNTDTSTPIPPSPTVTHLITQLPLVVATIQPTTAVPTATSTTTIPTTAAPSPTLTPTMILPTATFTETPEASTAEPTLPVTIVIEGPIQSINGTTIIIFDLTIVLNADDLATVHIGDMVRVEGSYAVDSQMIIAIHVTVLRNTPIPNSGVETNPSTGQVWTDPGNCSNPPPPWAPANGWRRRCQGAPNPGNSGGNGMGMGDD